MEHPNDPDNRFKPWFWDEKFRKAVVGLETLLSDEKLHVLYQCLNNSCHLDGDVAEVGVYKGGTAKMIARSAKDKTIHLFDTFEGLPEANPNFDTHVKGQFAADFETVKTSLSEFDNVVFYKGFFPETAAGLEKQFCFVHVDVDLYQSVIDACNYFWPRLVPEGMIVFDDYGALSCKGARVAVDRKFNDKLYIPTGQCIVMKHSYVKMNAANLKLA